MVHRPVQVAVGGGQFDQRLSSGGVEGGKAGHWLSVKMTFRFHGGNPPICLTKMERASLPPERCAVIEAGAPLIANTSSSPAFAE